MSKVKKPEPLRVHAEPEAPDNFLEIPENAAPVDGEKYILRRKKVDKYNVISSRVRYTPAVCDVCGLDIAELNNLGYYEDMDPHQQKLMREAVQMHKQEVHGPASQVIVEGESIPRAWLGTPNRRA